jgi:uracil-DNA glycosylase family 4
MIQGFFDLGVSTQPEKSKPSKKTGCEECGLGNQGHLEVRGKGRKRVLLVMEHPGKGDFSEQEYYSGDASGLLYDVLKELGIDPVRDCWITAAVLCPCGTEVTSREAGHCHPKLYETIAQLQPSVIIPLGVVAVSGLLANRLTGRMASTRLTDFFGETIPDQELGAWICPTYTPRHALGKGKDVRKLLTSQLKTAFTLHDTDLPVDYADSCIQWTVDKTEALAWIEAARAEAKYLTFDYETTGLKPQREGHEIVCASIAYGSGKDLVCQAFPMFEDAEFLDSWKKLLTSKRVKKIAHNSSFEMNWTQSILGYWVNSWGWDTCLAAHAQHNQKPTNLKFCTYVNFGVAGYDEAVDSFLTQPRDRHEADYGTNSINRVRECPISVLLPYCAKDSYYSHLLAVKQMDYFKATPDFYRGVLFLIKGQEELTRCHAAGMLMDLNKVESTRKEIRELTAAKQLEVMQAEEAKKWRDATGKTFNPASDDQLSKLLFDHLEFAEVSGRSVDESVLTKIGTPFCKAVLELRKLAKISGYIDGYLRESVDGVLRPFFNLHGVKTFRSSSDSPNFQNIPKRDAMAKKLIRSLFKPRPGNRIKEYDYKAVEVCISACYHHDPAMIRYIKDPTTDMHRDTAMDLFSRTKEDFRKDERQAAKNGFVFPSFYGSSARPQKGETLGSITTGIWEQIAPETKVHLKTKGIHTIEDFQTHVEAVEEIFWKKRFGVYDKWRNTMYAQCREQGYYDLFTGFRVYMPMKFTEAINAPIQGSAFHCLLWTLIEAGPRVRALSGRSMFIGQIHDALIADIHPDEEAQVDAIIKEVGTQLLREFWDWIIVPLTVEHEASKVDGTWAEMESLGNL